MDGLCNSIDRTALESLFELAAIIADSQKQRGWLDPESAKGRAAKPAPHLRAAKSK
jgi:hypothetical protein